MMQPHWEQLIVWHKEQIESYQKMIEIWTLNCYPYHLHDAIKDHKKKIAVLKRMITLENKKENK